jgi:hypothetical protein
MKSLIILILIGITGGITYWQTQISSADQGAIPSAENWHLPNWNPPSYLTDIYTNLQKLKLWQAESTEPITVTTAQAAKNSLTISWRLVGIVNQGGRLHVLLFDNNTNKVSNHTSPSVLPNGVHLVKIHDDYIEVMQKGKREVLYLYKKE